MMSPLEAYYSKLPSGYQELLLATRDCLLGLEFAMQQTFKWSTPCFEVNGKQVCYLYHRSRDRKTYIAFPAGRMLTCELLEHSGQQTIRYIRLSPDEDLPVPEIQSCIEQQIAWNKEHKSAFVLNQKRKLK